MRTSQLRGAALALAIAALPGSASRAGDAPVPVVDTTHYTLSVDTGARRIHIDSGGLHPRIRVPWDWVMGGGAHLDPGESELESYVSSRQFDTHITAFAIHDDLIGLHLSSYGVQRGGSAQAAAGRDLVLVYTPSSRKLSAGDLNLGITQSRLRSGGCFAALQTRFVLADIDHDRFMDLGVRQEALTCRQRATDAGEITEGPYYQVQPLRWYRYGEGRYTHDPRYDGRFPGSDHWELPMIGLVKGPVEYVQEMTRRSLPAPAPADRH